MYYYPGQPVPTYGQERLGWIQLAVSAASFFYNIADESKKTTEAERTAIVLRNAAGREAEAAAAQAEADRQKKDAMMNAVKKTLPIIGVVAAATVAGLLLGRS